MKELNKLAKEMLGKKIRKYWQCCENCVNRRLSKKENLGYLCTKTGIFVNNLRGWCDEYELNTLVDLKGHKTREDVE